MKDSRKRGSMSGEGHDVHKLLAAVSAKLESVRVDDGIDVAFRQSAAIVLSDGKRRLEVGAHVGGEVPVIEAGPNVA